MEQVHVIRHKALVEDKSIRSIAREMGILRNIVSRHLIVSESGKPARRNKASPVVEAVPSVYPEAQGIWALSRV